MKRPTAVLPIVLLLLGGSTSLLAQGMAADKFLDSVSASSVHDQAERDRGMNAYMALNTAPPAEVTRVLPVVLEYVHIGNEIHVRAYAAQFLLGIALRLDVVSLLGSRDEEISPLIVDDDPTIQRTAVTIAYYVAGRARTANASYESALMTGIQNPRTPQDTAVQMIGLLLNLGYLASKDPAAIQAVLDFLHRDDLTFATRMEILHSMPNDYDPLERISRYLCKSFDDPDPRVRAAAVISFVRGAPFKGDPRTESAFHRLAKDRVERMAKDADENPQVRELAKKALAGDMNLNPNIDMQSVKPSNH